LASPVDVPTFYSPAPMHADDKLAYARAFPIHVGVDTGKTFHKLVARGPDGRRTKAITVQVTRAGFDAADAHLTTLFPDVSRERMLVGIEFAGHHGQTFAADLHRRGYAVVTVLASVTKRFKEVEDNSPRKDDAKDAAQICRLVGDGLFVSYALLDRRAIALRALTTERQRLAVEETRLKNRLLSVLDVVWPEFAATFPNVKQCTPFALLRRWPTPTDLGAERPTRVRALIRKVSQNHFAPDRITAFLEAAAATIGLADDRGARHQEIRRIMARWLIVRLHIGAVEAQLTELAQEMPAVAALTTVPGISIVSAATLVAELGTPASYESPRQVLKLAGMNLAGKESGTSVRSRIRQTKRGRPALRRQLFLLAGRCCRTGGLCHEQYLALVARNGGSRVSAVCAIARKLVPMLLHIMQTTEPFDAARWQVLKRQSPYRAA
jgi:transposase